MNHKEDYVSLEQAKALKELGFDWECRAVYANNFDSPYGNGFCYGIGFSEMNYNNSDFGYSAPTLAQAQKWLREVKELDLDITLYRKIDAREKPAKIKRYYNCELSYSEDEEDLYDDFDSYEQAQSAGIDKALELLKWEQL